MLPCWCFASTGQLLGDVFHSVISASAGAAEQSVTSQPRLRSIVVICGDSGIVLWSVERKISTPWLPQGVLDLSGSSPWGKGGKVHHMHQPL